MTLIQKFVAGLPKAELHVHIEGTLEPATKFRLAARNRIKLAESTVEEVQATYDFTDLPSFLKVYYPAMRVLVTAADFRDLMYEYLRRASAEGVRHAEVFFDPQAHTGRGVAFGTVISGLRQGIVDARRELSISATLIPNIVRDFSPEFAMSMLLEALRYKDWIVGIGLDSDDAKGPPGTFAAVYRRAREEGLWLTAHCDIDQPSDIRTVLKDLQVDRIDHGTDIVRSPDLMRCAIEKKVGFTACPISNRFCTGDLQEDEIGQLIAAGGLVTINSDDPAYFRGYINDNYVALAEQLDLGPAQLAALARNSFEVAWISAPQRAAYLAAVDAHVAAWNTRSA